MAIFAPKNKNIDNKVIVLTSYKKDYTFTGISAHAGAAPQHGRSALDAVELMNVGVNFLREHMDLVDDVDLILSANGTWKHIFGKFTQSQIKICGRALSAAAF